MTFFYLSVVEIFRFHLTLILFYLKEERKDDIVLFNNTLNTFYLWLHDVGHMVKDHWDTENESQFMDYSLWYFICTIPQTG